MNNSERQYIRNLFETGNFMEQYQVQAETIDEMLSIDNQQDFYILENFSEKIEIRKLLKIWRTDP